MSLCKCKRCTVRPERPDDKLIVEGYGLSIMWLVLPFLFYLGGIILQKAGIL